MRVSPENGLAQTSDETDFAPLLLLPAYNNGKMVADAVCLVWENRELILAAGKAVVKAAKIAVKAFKKGLKFAKSPAMKKSIASAAKFMKSKG